MLALTFRPGLNAKTVNNYVTVLRRAMDMAVADHALEDNLVRHVRYQRQQTPFPDPFTRDEVEAIIEHMTERYPDGVANYVEFKFFSGLRPSETTALRWADVDLERDRIHVHRAIVRGLEKNTTKTSTARHVLLNSRARTALLRQRALTQLAGDFVFLDPRYGKPWTARARLQAQLLGANVEVLEAALPAALQHPPQLRDDDADVLHDASVLCGTTGTFRRHAAEHLRPLAGRRAQRHGDGSAGSGASARFIPGFVPEPATLAGYVPLTAEGGRGTSPCIPLSMCAADLSQRLGPDVQAIDLAALFRDGGWGG